MQLALCQAQLSWGIKHRTNTAWVLRPSYYKHMYMSLQAPRRQSWTSIQFPFPLPETIPGSMLQHNVETHRPRDPTLSEHKHFFCSSLRATWNWTCNTLHVTPRHLLNPVPISFSFACAIHTLGFTGTPKDNRGRSKALPYPYNVPSNNYSFQQITETLQSALLAHIAASAYQPSNNGPLSGSPHQHSHLLPPMPYSQLLWSNADLTTLFWSHGRILWPKAILSRRWLSLFTPAVQNARQ